MEDTNIVDLYLRREETAIEHTANQYGMRLRQISMNIVNNPSDVDDEENKTINKVIIGIYNKSLTKRGEYRELVGIDLA